MAAITSLLATIDESARRRFEQAWKDGRTPDIAEFLPSLESQFYLPTLEELVHIDLEFRWRAGDKGAVDKGAGDKGDSGPARNLLEHYLAAFPALQTPSILRRLIEQERRVRSRAGDKPATGDYAARFPELGPEAHAALDTSSLSSDPDPTGLTPPGHSKTMLGTARIPGYEILEVLGRGGIGVVYKARQVRLNRLVAVKMLLAGVHAGGEERARFEREAEAVARLTHPHIVQVHEVGETEGRLYIVFEFLPGGNLGQKLAGTPLPAEEAATLLATLADAMQHAHSHGVIHRDLKPTNVMLTLDGAAKIGDFGLAKQLTEEQGATRTGDILGTPSYMAPEQAAGRIKEMGPATDVYALGAILYEVVTGRPPFRAETAWETLSQVLATEPVTPRQLSPRLPTDLETICLKCLEKDPAKRYPTAQEFAADLRRFLAHEPIVARPAGTPEKLWRWCLRNPSLSAAAALLVLLLVGTTAGAVWFGFHQQQVALDLKAAKDRGDAALAQSNRLSADLLFERGLGYCQRGEVDLGILWMDKAYRLTSEQDADLRAALRANLGVWSQQLATLHQPLRFDGPIAASRRSTTGRYVATVHVEKNNGRSLRLWDMAAAKAVGSPLPLSEPVAPQMAFAADEKSLWVIAEGKLGRLDCATGQWIGERVPCAGGRPLEMAVSARGDYLALMMPAAPAKGVPYSSQLEIVETRSGRRVKQPLVLPGSARLAFVPEDGSLLMAVTSSTKPAGNEFLDPQAAVHQYRVPELTVVHAPCPILGRVARLVCSPRGGQFAVLSQEGSAWLVSTASRIPFGLTTPSYDGTRLVPPTLEFSPDGKWLAVANGQTVSVAATHDPAAHTEWQAHDREIASLAFDASGELLVTASLDGTTRLWDPRSGRRIGMPIRRDFSATAPWAVCDPAGTRLLVGGDGRALEWWDLAAVRRSSGRAIAHEEEVTHVAFAPGTSLVASVAALHPPSTLPTGPLIEDDLPPPIPGGALPGGQLPPVTVPNPAQQPVANPNLTPPSPPLPTPGRPAEPLPMGRPASPPPVGPPPGLPRLPPFPMGQDLLLPPPPLIPLPPDVAIMGPAAGPSALRLWDLHGQEAVAPVLHPARINCLAFRPGEVLTGSQDGFVRRYRLPGGEPAGEPLALDQPVSVLAVSGDGAVIAAGGSRGRIRRWRADTGQPLAPELIMEKNLETNLNEVSLNRDGTMMVAAAARIGGGRIWRLGASGLIGEPQRFPGGNPGCAVLSPDGRWVLANDTSPHAWLLDTTTGKSPGERIPHSYPVLCAAFSPDGTILATGSGMSESTPRGEVCLFRVDTREPIGTPLVHDAPVGRVAFDGSGRRLLSFASGISGGGPLGADLTTAQVWDVATGKRIGPPRRESRDTLAAALAPGGDWLATGGSRRLDDSTVPGSAPPELIIDEDSPPGPPASGPPASQPFVQAQASSGEAHLWPLPPLEVSDERLADWTATLMRRRLNARGLPETIEDEAWEAARAKVSGERGVRSGE